MYPTIVEMQSAVTAADQARIGRDIASKAVSNQINELASFLLEPFFQFWIKDEGMLFDKGRDFEFSLILVVGKVIQC